MKLPSGKSIWTDFLQAGRYSPVQRPSWERAPPVGSEGKKVFVAGAPEWVQAPGAEAESGEIIWSQNEQSFHPGFNIVGSREPLGL